MQFDLKLGEQDTQDREQPSEESAHETTWITPDFVEVSTCAEICAYVYVAR